jgi:uncharacterized ferredoxin-like protein
MDRIMNQDESLISRGIGEVAALMEIAAGTAPKSRGEDYVRIKTITGDGVPLLSEAMIRFGREKNRQNFDRDGGNVAASKAVVLIGLKDSTSLGLDCGACGFDDCNKFAKAPRTEGDFAGPICAYRHLDLGIALGSAVKTAQLMNIDNRIMYRAGVVSRWMGLVDWDYVMGIPLSAAGKNIYFDRAETATKKSSRS